MAIIIKWVKSDGTEIDWTRNSSQDANLYKVGPDKKVIRMIAYKPSVADEGEIYINDYSWETGASGKNIYTVKDGVLYVNTSSPSTSVMLRPQTYQWIYSDGKPIVWKRASSQSNTGALVGSDKSIIKYSSSTAYAKASQMKDGELYYYYDGWKTSKNKIFTAKNGILFEADRSVLKDDIIHMKTYINEVERTRKLSFDLENKINELVTVLSRKVDENSRITTIRDLLNYIDDGSLVKSTNDTVRFLNGSSWSDSVILNDNNKAYIYSNLKLYVLEQNTLKEVYQLPSSQNYPPHARNIEVLDGKLYYTYSKTSNSSTFDAYSVDLKTKTQSKLYEHTSEIPCTLRYLKSSKKIINLTRNVSSSSDKDYKVRIYDIKTKTFSGNTATLTYISNADTTSLEQRSFPEIDVIEYGGYIYIRHSNGINKYDYTLTLKSSLRYTRVTDYGDFRAGVSRFMQKKNLVYYLYLARHFRNEITYDIGKPFIELNLDTFTYKEIKDGDQAYDFTKDAIYRSGYLWGTYKVNLGNQINSEIGLYRVQNDLINLSIGKKQVDFFGHAGETVSVFSPDGLDIFELVKVELNKTQNNVMFGIINHGRYK